MLHRIARRFADLFCGFRVGQRVRARDVIGFATKRRVFDDLHKYIGNVAHIRERDFAIRSRGIDFALACDRSGIAQKNLHEQVGADRCDAQPDRACVIFDLGVALGQADRGIQRRAQTGQLDHILDARSLGRIKRRFLMRDHVGMGRRDQNKRVCASHRLGQACRIGKVGLNNLGACGKQAFGLARVPRHRTGGDVLFGKFCHQNAAHIAGCASYNNHRVSPLEFDDRSHAGTIPKHHALERPDVGLVGEKVGHAAQTVVEKVGQDRVDNLVGCAIRDRIPCADTHHA